MNQTINYDGILIRYGELVLKGKNRNFFAKRLQQNIENILNTKVDRQYDRIFADYEADFIEKLKFIPGINSFSPIVKVDKNLQAVEQVIISLIKDEYKTFKISARRNDKSFELNSQELNGYFGGFVLRNSNLKVDVKNPDWELVIEVRKDAIYLISESIKGIGGLPVGVTGKSIHLLSGGFDSPVAAIELMKRGVEVIFLAFITPPHTDALTIEKLKNLMKVFSKYQGRSKLYLTGYTDLMNYINFTSDQSYKITLMRRSFIRLANQLAKNENAMVISTGENLAQVASQTIQSLNVIGEQSKWQILRPLITFNKEDIIQLAKKYGTHDISVIQASESCELFAPEKPVITPNLHHAVKLENELNEIPDFENKIIENFKVEIFKAYE